MTVNTIEASSHVSPQRVLQIAWGYAPTLIVEAALRLRIFDLLDVGPMGLSEVAEETAASPRGLRSLLNALVGLEFLSKDSQARYSLTPESAAFLVSSRPGYLGGVYRHAPDRFLPVWSSLVDAVRTGKPKISMNEEAPCTEFFSDFVEDLFPINFGAAQAFAKSLDLGGRREPTYVLDIACGAGVWGIALAQESEHVRVTGVDWPGVLPAARRMAERFEIADQFEFIGGDIRETEFGADYDIAVFGHVLHGIGEARVRTLLSRAYGALAPGGTIVIAEAFVNEERTGPPQALIHSVIMLLNTDDGDTHTLGEMQQWLIEAGFVEPRPMSVPSAYPLIVAHKPYSS
ncbi:hypothetical protein CCAX7_005960 [Capsulimonas corticalis]|uniref:Uncharacterized protein n=1 Tax=Capsulimonas corticalis TaxID=2219043 RepID=A0A402D3E2_9BACT|nr:class I SAM-dependent methyltransferase [Capsulimonas corticalis]BDI28545.1 hypothetical protein CCAX7_005960 [Capsulimonas corticalis]